jgi:hypothetical protein
LLRPETEFIMTRLRAVSVTRSRRRFTPSGPAAVATAAALLLAAFVSGPAPASASSIPSSRDPAVVSEWNQIAVTTLGADATKLGAETILYMGLVQAAVYDAVVGVKGGYQPYVFNLKAPRGTSAQAAAVAAAHQVLVTYSPYATATLDAAYATSLAAIPDGWQKTAGIAFGNAVASYHIAVRSNDGRNAPVLFTKPPAPGVWRPTPPAFLPMADPWLGGVTPLMLHSATQFRPVKPPALTSQRYTRDFAEVKKYGSATSAARNPAQTATAVFFSGNAVVQYNAALRDQVTVRHLGIVRAARMFAAVDMTVADTIISVWHSKYLYGFWRPVTAINLADTDGNPATTADPSWAPLLATPPYPDYVSGYSAYTAAFSAALEALFGTHHLRLTLTSTAVPDIRSYDSGEQLRSDVVNARIWLGIHFRFADTAARRMGVAVANWTLERFFQPTHQH